MENNERVQAESGMLQVACLQCLLEVHNVFQNASFTLDNTVGTSWIYHFKVTCVTQKHILVNWARKFRKTTTNRKPDSKTHGDTRRHLNQVSGSDTDQQLSIQQVLQSLDCDSAFHLDLPSSLDGFVGYSCENTVSLHTTPSLSVSAVTDVPENTFLRRFSVLFNHATFSSSEAEVSRQKTEVLNVSRVPETAKNQTNCPAEKYL